MISKKEKLDSLAGYALRGSNLGDDARGPLLLPIWLVDQLEHESLERERLNFEGAETEAAEKARKRTQEWEQRSFPPPPGSTPSHKPPLTPLQAAQASTVPDKLPPQPSNTVAVFDWDAARERFELLKSHPATADKDLVARDLRHFAKAMANGPWRSVAWPGAWREDLQQLAAEMPNFSGVVEAIQHAMALAELSGGPPKPQPILLLGEPGVGKTYFTHRLAEVLQTTIHRQSFDNAQTTTALRGADRHWGTSAVGALWELIVLGRTANPLIVLDELDKGVHAGNHYRPVDALLSLLEPVTASKVKDVSVDFEFDASHVVYIATANDAERISAPVRSRFLEFFIDEPDIDGRLALVHSIFEATLKRLVPVEEVRAAIARPTDLQICRLAWMTPRQIRMAVERALGAAVYAGRHHFEDSDFAAPKAQVDAGARSQRRKDSGDDANSVSVARG
jgi:ATP-dependent Lon protease